jgi:hypothetical protein
VGGGEYCGDPGTGYGGERGESGGVDALARRNCRGLPDSQPGGEPGGEYCGGRGEPGGEL